MATLFISDLHLEDGRPELGALLLRFLASEEVRSAQALYILGDLFEYWIGDDFLSETARQVGAHAAVVEESPAVVLAGQLVFGDPAEHPLGKAQRGARRRGLELVLADPGKRASIRSGQLEDLVPLHVDDRSPDHPVAAACVRDEIADLVHVEILYRGVFAGRVGRR